MATLLLAEHDNKSIKDATSIAIARVMLVVTVSSRASVHELARTREVSRGELGSGCTVLAMGSCCAADMAPSGLDSAAKCVPHAQGPATKRIRSLVAKDRRQACFARTGCVARR